MAAVGADQADPVDEEDAVEEGEEAVAADGDSKRIDLRIADSRALGEAGVHIAN